MSKVPTKERIIDAALTLFSERGFEGTSVDQLAELVGIKGPSLYRHFEGKEDILDTLIDQSEEYYWKNFGDVNQYVYIPDSVDDFIQASMDKIRFTLHDEKIKKMRKFFAIEQFRNEKIAKLTTLHHMTGVVELYTHILSEMMKKEIFREEDPELLAFELITPVTLLVHMVDREPDREEEALQTTMRHFEHFAKLYAVEK